jgi:hypothetical protein
MRQACPGLSNIAQLEILLLDSVICSLSDRVCVRRACQVTQDNEERRLLALGEECHTEKLAASDKLSNPRRSLLYPTYMRLADELAAIKLKCHRIFLAIREHRRKRERDAGD